MTIEGRKRVFSKAARADLRAIYRYIAKENPQAASAFVLDIDRKMVAIFGSGLSGIARDDLRPGLRQFPYRERLIFVRVIGRSLVIVRILHGRQNISPDDFPESDMT